MARVTEEEVKDIIDTDVQLEPFIQAANLTVDQHLKNKRLSKDLLKEIERWLSAHFAAIQDPQAVSERINGLQQNFGIQKGLGLDATQYGQQVKVLDPTGTLAGLGHKKASIKAF